MLQCFHRAEECLVDKRQPLVPTPAEPEQALALDFRCAALARGDEPLRGGAGIYRGEKT